MAFRQDAVAVHMLHPFGLVKARRSLLLIFLEAFDHALFRALRLEFKVSVHAERSEHAAVVKVSLLLEQ